MDKKSLTEEEFLDLVEIFRILKRWRDERNARLLHQELSDDYDANGVN
jgi:uncharacterized protein YjiS (DUF1127 family)